MTKRKILVTSALLYANGPVHLGHTLEQIQTDIWVRFQRLRGHDCIYVCGDDAHGTPIMLSAEKLGMTPEALIQKIGIEHREDFRDFLISVDNYYTTHSHENKMLAETIYQRLFDRGDIKTRIIEQAYDPVKNMFLPDRYVKGECPRCGSADQYGDNCEVCGATYSPTELKNPLSTVSGATPVRKNSLHYFFQLNHYHEMLEQWIHSGHLQTEVTNKLKEWLACGLEPWDISRDGPYFGFKIPDTEDKYFYVWMDAPMGYMAGFKRLCSISPQLDFEFYWDKDSKAELYHFIGKDIIYFHGLFWPAMLHGAGFRMPTAIFTHGFLTIDGLKMSKSRATFIKSRTYLNHLHPEYLRYYFAAKLSGRSDDIDLNFADFMQRVNADLVGKVVNIASRCAGFISKGFDNQLASQLANPELFDKLRNAGEEIADLYENREYNHAVRKIMELADAVNQYIDEKKPWVLAKQINSAAEVQAVCTMGLNAFKQLMTYLKPILPAMAEKTEDFLNTPPLTWEDAGKPLLGQQINAFKPLMHRIDESRISALKAAVKQDAAAQQANL